MSAALTQPMSVASAPPGMVCYLKADPDTALPVFAVVSSGHNDLRFLLADTRLMPMGAIARFEVVA